MALVLRKSSNIANGIASCGGPILLGPDGIIPYTGSVNSLFDKVLKFESISGTVEYRLVYLYNDPANSTTAYQPRVKLLIVPESEIAIGSLSRGQVGQAIPTEKSAPAGVAFKTASDLAAVNNGYLTLDAPTLAPGEFCGIWLRRTTKASTGSGTVVEELVLEIEYRE